MAYDPSILEAQGISKVTLEAATSCVPGTLLGYNSGWVKADANSNPIVPATRMAMEYGAAGATVATCRAGVLWDRDAPFTAGDTQYLSATAGAFTATSPVIGTTLQLIQKIGRAHTTEYMHFDLVTGLVPLYLCVNQSIDLANITATTSLETAVTLTGILTTDVPIVCVPASLHNDLVVSGVRISANDTLQLRMTDIDNTNAIDDSARTYVFHFIRPN